MKVIVARGKNSSWMNWVRRSLKKAESLAVPRRFLRSGSSDDHIPVRKRSSSLARDSSKLEFLRSSSREGSFATKKLEKGVSRSLLHGRHTAYP